MNKSAEAALAASELIDSYIAGLGDWRSDALSRLRAVVLNAGPDLTEGFKWGTPVWESKGLVCSAGAFKGYVKLTFFKGASLADPLGLFNASLEAKAMRAIDFRQDDKIDAAGITALVVDAAAFNAAAKRK